MCMCVWHVKTRNGQANFSGSIDSFQHFRKRPNCLHEMPDDFRTQFLKVGFVNMGDHEDVPWIDRLPIQKCGYELIAKHDLGLHTSIHN